MNTASIQHFFSKLVTRMRSINFRSGRTWGVLAVTLAVLGAGVFFMLRAGDAPEVASSDALKSVSLINVSAYARVGAVKDTGTGSREIVVRAEMGGKVTRVAQEGSRVGFGQIVAELENSSQRAALLQAEGSIDSSSASLTRARRGTRQEQQSILSTNVSGAQANLSTAKDAAVLTLNSAYAAIDDAVRRKTDPMYTGADSALPRLSVPTTETQVATGAENTRLSFGAMLRRESARSQSLAASDDLASEIAKTDEELRLTRSYLDTLTVVLNKAIATQGVTEAQIVAFKADTAAARASVSASISALTSARETIASRASVLEVAQKTQVQGATPDEADILSASASVKQSQGSYASALAAYQKTLIRAPSAGTVISCSPSQGDVISIGADVCRISASGASSGTSFLLPLSSVKYTPASAFVYIIGASGTIEAKPVETGLVSADSITVAGLFGDERIIRDIRGLRVGEKVEVTLE